MAQSYDSYTPVWDDYKEDKKNALEKVFRTVDEETAEKIKGILIKDEHFKLSKRFQEFVVGHVGEDFFNYNEKRKIVGKEEFRVALVNAYNIRSKYAHMLKPLMKHLIGRVRYPDVLSSKQLLIIGYGRWIAIKVKGRRLE